MYLENRVTWCCRYCELQFDESTDPRAHVEAHVLAGDELPSSPKALEAN